MAEQRTTYELGELRSTGLLWLINASVFHPRGVALALVYDDDDGDYSRPTGFQLLPASDGEVWTFPDSPEIDELYRCAELHLGLARSRSL